MRFCMKPGEHVVHLNGVATTLRGDELHVDEEYLDHLTLGAVPSRYLKQRTVSMTAVGMQSLPQIGTTVEVWIKDVATDRERADVRFAFVLTKLGSCRELFMDDGGEVRLEGDAVGDLFIKPRGLPLRTYQLQAQRARRDLEAAMARLEKAILAEQRKTIEVENDPDLE